jgi:hypothetical protein
MRLALCLQPFRTGASLPNMMQNLHAIIMMSYRMQGEAVESIHSATCGSGNRVEGATLGLSS